MDIEDYGIILNVYNFDECVLFYKSLFGLPEMFSKVDGDFKLTCLAFGSAYLMLESGGVACSSKKTFSQNPAILRFNVADIHKALEAVQEYDSEAKIIENDWGSIIRCIDPDGNPISIRESSGFQAT